MTTASGATTQNLSLSYNANGDRIGSTDSISGKSRTYGYDGADRLTSFSQGNTSATYAYNGDGLRMSKTVNGTPEAFTWDEAEGLPLILQDGSTKYVTRPDGLPLEQVTSSGVLYYYQDQLGSTRGLLDQSGTTVATYTYDAYGSVTSSTGTVANPFQYAGQYTDAESGLQYLRARYYDPSTGQFLTVDPLASATGEPYTYVHDDPLNAIDITGECPASAGSRPQAAPPDLHFYKGPYTYCAPRFIPPLTRGQLKVAKLIYHLAKLFGMSDQHAKEMVAAAYMESTLNPGAVNGPAGGLFQLYSSNYIDWAHKHGGIYNPTTNTLAVINSYRAYWSINTKSKPGDAASAVEASGCSPAWYAWPLHDHQLPWAQISKWP